MMVPTAGSRPARAWRAWMVPEGGGERRERVGRGEEGEGKKAGKGEIEKRMGEKREREGDTGLHYVDRDAQSRDPRRRLHLPSRPPHQESHPPHPSHPPHQESHQATEIPTHTTFLSTVGAATSACPAIRHISATPAVPL